MAAAAAGREPASPGEPPEDWIEVTAMGSRESEWIPRHPLRHPPPGRASAAEQFADPALIVQSPRARRTLLARQYDRVGGPYSGELAEKIASPSCADCGMYDEPADHDRRCRFCAELAALRPAVVPPARGRAGTISALAILLLLLTLAVGMGLLLSGALR